MDYALIVSGTVYLFTCAMTDVSDDFTAKLVFRAMPLAASIVPIIAGLDGLGVI